MTISLVLSAKRHRLLHFITTFSISDHQKSQRLRRQAEPVSGQWIIIPFFVCDDLEARQHRFGQRNG